MEFQSVQPMIYEPKTREISALSRSVPRKAPEQ
jgi:hypothetical protein